VSRRDYLIATLRAFDRVKTGGSWAILMGYDLPKLRAELASLNKRRRHRKQWRKS